MTIATALLDQVYRLGGQIEARGDHLKLCAPRPLPDALLAELKAHKAELLTLLASNDDTVAEAAGEATFCGHHKKRPCAPAYESAAQAAEERAAILEYDAGLPRPEAEAVAALAHAFYNHLFGVAKATGCCYARAERYCPEGRRLREAYYSAVH